MWAQVLIDMPQAIAMHRRSEGGEKSTVNSTLVILGTASYRLANGSQETSGNPLAIVTRDNNAQRLINHQPCNMIQAHNKGTSADSGNLSIVLFRQFLPDPMGAQLCFQAGKWSLCLVPGQGCKKQGRLGSLLGSSGGRGSGSVHVTQKALLIEVEPTWLARRSGHRGFELPAQGLSPASLQ